MKDVLLLHDNARPHNILCTWGAVTKMGRTVLPHPALSPDLAPSDYHLFDPVKDECVDAILYMTKNTYKVLMMCSEFEAQGFATLVYSILLYAGKIVLKMLKTLWKSNLVITKDVRITHVNVIVIAITLSEKLEALLSYHPSYIQTFIKNEYGLSENLLI
jgi:hypothetical protein